MRTIKSHLPIRSGEAPRQTRHSGCSSCVHHNRAMTSAHMPTPPTDQLRASVPQFTTQMAPMHHKLLKKTRQQPSTVTANDDATASCRFDDPLALRCRLQLNFITDWQRPSTYPVHNTGLSSMHTLVMRVLGWSMREESPCSCRDCVVCIFSGKIDRIRVNR